MRAKLGAEREAKDGAPVPRVPCPLCGGAIHPVAGRCKHCKQDLTSHRGRGPGDAVGGPRLAAGTGPMGQGPLGSLSSLSPGVVAIGLPSYPVEAGPAGARRGWLANWPLIVITLAVIGMIVALVLLILPQHEDGGRRGKRLPGSDNMETDVLPKSGKAGVIDPWAPSPRSNAQPDVSPPPPAPVDPAPTDDSSADSDDSDDADPATGSGTDDSDIFGGLVGPSPDPDDVVTPDEVDPGQLGGQLGGQIDPLDALGDPYQLFGRNVSAVSLMSAHACARAAECGGRRSRLAACAKLVQPRKSQRPAARCNNSVMLMTCLQEIDSLPCDVPPSLDLVQRIPACLHLLAC